MWQRKTKVMFLWTILSSISNGAGFLIIDKRDCGVTKSCYSEPPSCTSSHDCEYLLKYVVTEQDVLFEVSTNKYGWIAVGFNSKNTMVGGESLACEKHKSPTLVHYKMPEYSRPTPSIDTKATTLSTIEAGNILYCKFQRKLNLEPSRYNLSNPVYLLYAAGYMENTERLIQRHKYAETSQNLLSLSSISDNSDPSKAKKRIDTSLCGQSLGCSRIPSGCHDNTDCDFLLTLNKTGTNVEFSVSGKADGWIAVGFNDKPKMGGTDAVICQTRGGDVKLFVANLEYDSPDLNNPNETLLLDGKYESGVIYCKFTRPLKTKANKRLSIDVFRYIIYAKGSGTTTLNEHKDGDNGCSDVRVDVGNNIVFQLGRCGTGRLAKVHGSFMIFAWMFLAVISIFIARYSRSLWKGWRIWGDHAWFQFHRGIMGLAVLLTVIAIIIIFVDRGGWSESAGDHAIFGIIVLVFAIIQPTIAFFRPHPNETRRPFFNWFHRLVALILMIMAVVTVSKGTHLLEDSGGNTSYKVLIALIVIVIIMALVLEFLALRIRTKKLMDLTTEESIQEKPNILEIKMQCVLLVVFSLIVFVLAVVMIAYVAGAGSDDDDDDD